jgi:hypothetical protein
MQLRTEDFSGGCLMNPVDNLVKHFTEPTTAERVVTLASQLDALTIGFIGLGVLFVYLGVQVYQLKKRIHSLENARLSK